MVPPAREMVRGMAGDPNSSMVVGGVVVNRKSPAPASSSMMVMEAERLEEARRGEVGGAVWACVCVCVCMCVCVCGHVCVCVCVCVCD